MNQINHTLSTLEFAQFCWVVPDIHRSMEFLGNALGISFPEPELVRPQDLQMSYRGNLEPGEWLTTQAYNGRFIEIVQPLTGKNMFQDYLDKHPAGGVQHIAYRLPVDGFDEVTSKLRIDGYAVISEVDHPIARMAFFDTYQILGVVTEIMGITPEGWKAIRQMELG